MDLRNIQLHKGRERSILRKHPWVFSRAISHDTSDIQDGEIVRVRSHKDENLAVGHFQDGSIKVRILRFDDGPIDYDFYYSKLESAFSTRAMLGFPSETTNAFRLVHGEGDGLPGLIVDVYGDTAILQAHSIGMHKQADIIARAIQDSSKGIIQKVYSKSVATLPSQYPSEVEDRFLIGEGGDALAVKENNVQFLIDYVHGQKTGFFLDQRVNRDLLSTYARGKSVLNCFCYTGGFSMYALAKGASEVHSIDVSDKAMKTLKQNLELNDFDRHHAYTDNVMKYLTRSTEPKFDIVIVDPPAFAKSVRKRHNAIQAYKRLNALALQRVHPGGLLFTFSCSQVVDNQMFYDTIVAACIESGRSIRVLHRLSQGPDHPVNIFHPEGNYLKGLVLKVD